jgi:hypothetical protein
MRATDGTLRIAALGESEYRRLVGQLLAASVFVALALALFLLARRAAGAFSAPLPASQLLALAIFMAVWAVVVRELTSRNPLYVSLALVVLLMFALACSFPGSRVVDWLFWSAAMFAVVLCPPLVRSREARPQRHQIATAEFEQDEASGEQIIQQLTRLRTGEGHDALRGMLVAEFGSDERQATLYVAFCPPFERLPRVEVNLADDSDASVKLTQVLHNGVQLDVRLAHPSAIAASVAVEFFASDAASD